MSTTSTSLGDIWKDEDRLQQILDATTDGIWDWDIASGTMLINPAYHRMLGLDTNVFETTWEKWHGSIHPQDLPRVDEALRRHVEDPVRNPYVVEYRMRHRDGSWVPIYSRGRVVKFDAERHPLRMLGTHTDLSLLKMTENALTESDTRLRVVSEMSQDMISRHDLEGRFQWASPATLQIMGLSPEEILGHTPFEFVHPDDLEAAAEMMREAIETGRGRVQYRIGRKGRPLWVDTVAVVAADQKTGKPFEMHCWTRDISEQVRQKELLESAQKLAKLGGWSIDLAAGKTSWTSEMYAMFGQCPTDGPLSIESWCELLEPASKEQLLASYSELIEQGRPWNLVLKGWTLRGSPLLVRTTCEGTFADGEIRILNGTTQDITEQELLRREFEEASRFNQSILDTTEALIVVLDPEGRIVRFNQACVRLSGWKESEVLGKSFFDLMIPANEHAAVHEIFDRLSSGIAPSHHENSWTSRDGRLAWISWDDSVLFDDDGRIRYVLTTGIDMTQRRRTESVLETMVRATSSLFGQTFFDTLTKELAHLLEVECVIIGRISPARDRIQTLSFFSNGRIAVPAEVPFSGSILENFQEQGSLFIPSGFRQRFPDFHFLQGIEVESYMGIALFNAAHELVGVMCVIHSKPLPNDELARSILAIFADRARTEIERFEADQALHHLNAELEQRVQSRTSELQSSNRELESFAYSVSHDLRSPLRAMDGFAQALVEDYEPLLDETGKDYVDRIRRASNRMADLIDDLLSLSRSSRYELDKTDLDLSAMAREIVDGLRTSNPEREVEVEIEPALRAFADPVLLRAALANLLDNSWKYTRRREHPRISFHSEPAGKGFVGFAVSDNGAGFDMTHANKLFGTFQRLHTTDEFEGNGIGLATVRRILERHGGSISALGEVGKGATFSFQLPLAPPLGILAAG